MIQNILTKKSTTKSGKKETYLSWWVTLILSIALAVGTWNPTGHHFIHYISNVEDILSGFTPFFILIMFSLWYLAIKSMFQSLGFIGMIISTIVLLTFIWGLQEYHIIDLNDLSQLGWALTIGKGLLIWFGLNASIIWKKLTGIYTTDASSSDL